MLPPNHTACDPSRRSSGGLQDVCTVGKGDARGRAAATFATAAAAAAAVAAPATAGRCASSAAVSGTCPATHLMLLHM
eukprot:scaffold43416_cov20-Tisochrysis_lutea.AAC.3